MTILRFPPQAIAQAQSVHLSDSLWQRPQVQGITIDGPYSRDLDDAIWIEATPSGAILWVHIADVAELVRPGSFLDKVVIARTQTRYFGRGNDPMLPRVLSENKLSLLAFQERPTLSVRITLDAAAQIEEVSIFESWLSSQKKFSYQEADCAQDDPGSPFQETLQLSHQWAERLNRARGVAGAIGGIATGRGDWLDEDGRPIRAEERRYNSHLIIQEFMIAANRAVAQWLADADAVALYRNHTARDIAPDRETMYKTLLMLGSGAALRRQVQNWLNRADYGPVLIGHFALNLPAYCHFTSPIRRLADLINHRIVKARLHDQPPPYTKTDLEQLAQYIAQVSREYENESEEYFKADRKQQHQESLRTAAELEQIAEKEFSHLLKYAITHEDLEPIRREVETRLEDKRLQIQDLYLLLFRSNERALQQRVCAHLAQNVQDGPSIISMACSVEEQWQQFRFVEESGPPFHAWLEVEREGEVWTTVDVSVHLRKQGARHHACLAWIKAYVEDALVTPEQRTQARKVVVEKERAPFGGEREEIRMLAETMDQEQVIAEPKLMHPILTKTLKDEHNFIGVLSELCQAFQWPSAEYEFSNAGDEFSCECQLEAMNERFSGKASAPKKQLVKHRAARVVLEQLQGRVN
jgi:ribonuclease R